MTSHTRAFAGAAYTKDAFASFAEFLRSGTSRGVRAMDRLASAVVFRDDHSSPFAVSRDAIDAGGTRSRPSYWKGWYTLERDGGSRSGIATRNPPAKGKNTTRRTPTLFVSSTLESSSRACVSRPPPSCSSPPARALPPGAPRTPRRPKR